MKNTIRAVWVAALAAVGLTARAETWTINSAEDLERASAALWEQFGSQVENQTAQTSSGRRSSRLLGTVQSNASVTNYYTFSADTEITTRFAVPANSLLVFVLNGHTLSGTNGTAAVKNGTVALQFVGNGGMVAFRNGTVKGGDGFSSSDATAGGSGAAAVQVQGNVVFCIESDAEVKGGAGGNSSKGTAGRGAPAFLAGGNNTSVTVQMEEGANVYGGAGGSTDSGTPGSAGALYSGNVTLQTFTYTFDTASDDTADTVISAAYGTDVASQVAAAAASVPAKKGYTFNEWQFKGAKATASDYYDTIISSNLTYQADWTVNEYTISYDYNEGAAADGGTYPASYTVEDTINLATTVTTPVRTGYDFTGWSTNGVAVSTIARGTIGDFTLVANWQIQRYTIKFVSDGVTLSTQELDYGETVAEPNTPARASDAQNSYVFSAWSPAFESVATKSVTYEAQYTPSTRSYTITYDLGGSTETEVLTYGAMPAHADPSKSGSTFLGWSPAFAAVTGDATYIAQWLDQERPTDPDDPDKHFWLVSYVDENGGVLQSEFVENGLATPAFAGETPVKPATDDKTYAFDGWTPAVAATVTADTTYTATFAESDRFYRVTWVVDGTYEFTDCAWGETPTHTAPEKAGYTFTGWSPVVVAVAGDATYTAQFVEIPVQDPEDPNPKTYYLVTFTDDVGNVLQSDYYEADVDAVVPPSAPAKAATEQFSYTFAGWNAEVVSPAAANATYTATFDETLRSYTITWAIDGESEAEIYEYGWTPSYPGTPAKTSTATTDFTFTGWTPAVEVVTGDATYTAQFNGTTKPEVAETKATLTWKDEDGTVLATETVDKTSELPVAPVAPVKAATDEYSYEFTGWTPALAAVTADATYTAVYAATKRAYAVTWMVEGEPTVDTVEYGKVPSWGGATPAKAATAAFTYEFIGWSPTPGTVTGPATYTATFKATPVPGSAADFAITWLNDDLSVLREDAVTSSDIVEYGSTPLKASTAESDFTFVGWTPEVVSPAVESATYTAVYAATPRQYTITWDVDNVRTTTQAAYGATPAFGGATPAKAGYEFRGWSPAVATVTGDATYKAQWVEEPPADPDPEDPSYLIVYEDEDGNVLQSGYAKAGAATPAFVGSMPAKAGTDEFAYEFAGWKPAVADTVSGAATYTAAFTATKKTYSVTWTVEGVPTVSTVEYGQTPTFPGTLPAGFAGWSPEVVAVTGDAAYVAQIAAVPDPTAEPPTEFVVTFKDENGDILQTAA